MVRVDETTAAELPKPRLVDQQSPVDLLIIGGGILGLSTACEVLARGLSVTIFEEDPHRSAAWASAGMLSPYAERSQAGGLQDMMRASRVAYPAYVAHVEEQSGMKIELSFPGTIIPLAAGDDRAARLALLTEMGANCRYLDPAETKAAEPALGERPGGAILLDEEGYVNPRSLITALRMAVDHLGGRMVHLRVLGLVSRQARIVGVETAAGVVRGGAVLNAAGAWADHFLVPEDQDRYQVRPVRGQIVRLRPPSRKEAVRHVVQDPLVSYLVPRADGGVVCGSTSEDVGPFPGITAGGIASVLERTIALVPQASNWTFIGAWSGLRPRAGRDEIFLEADSSRKGLFHGLGLFRHGMLLAPTAATRMARLVVDYLGRHG